MGGIFGVVAEENCTMDLFFGIDYHSHLGTKRGGMAVYGEKGLDRAIHNIENSPFRTKFERDVQELKGHMGIGCISDMEPQPLLVHSHLGSFAITTVGRINNEEELEKLSYKNGTTHFLEMSGGRLNPTELVASLINQRDSVVEGIQHVQEMVEGSMTMLLMTDKGIYAARDRLGRTPLVIGEKQERGKTSYCASFESFAFHNLGYTEYRELGPSEIVYITPDGVETVSPARDEMKICSFLWVYYGYPTSAYEGVYVEDMRNNCGRMLAARDDVEVDFVAGMPDSGIAHAIGYANASNVPFARPFIKYTPTWPRSFMPADQEQRNLIARMKLIPVETLIRDKRLLIIEDSIVRGTQFYETTDFLYNRGAKELHIRPACPPVMFSCKYVNFSRTTGEDELITRRMIRRVEGRNITEKVLYEYADPDSERYGAMLDAIRKDLRLTTLQYNRLDDMMEAIGISPCNLCTYCWNGVE